MGFEPYKFDDMARQLYNLGLIDRIAPKMLAAAVPTLEDELKKQVKKEANRGYAKGDLVNSIKAGKPLAYKGGHYVAASAEGKDRKGMRNNEKLAYLHYGTSKQAATAVLTKTIRIAEPECLKIMQEEFDKEAGK